MISKGIQEKRQNIQYVSIEDLVPEDHLVRVVDSAIDFGFIYEIVEEKYSKDQGRPSLDPVVLFKMVLLQYLFGIRSMRQTVREIEVNNAYRWFLGFDLYDRVPHFTTFGKNYVRRFKDTDIFERIFARILEEAIQAGFVKAEAVFIDSTHVKANANKHKYHNEQVKRAASRYKVQLMKEINEIREKDGKDAFKDDDDDGGSGAVHDAKISTTDPESGVFHKGEHQKCFAYTAHVACDKHNFILAATVTPGNVHDSQVFTDVYQAVKKRHPEVEAIVVDAGYKTPAICKEIIDDGKMPVMPYKRPATKKDYFKKWNYVYDEYYNCYLCPQNEVLKYTTTNRDGYREYKSDPSICKNCPQRMQCTQSKNHTKVILRHIWEDYLETAEDIRHTPEGKALYTQRGQTIERVFADAKEKHGMRYTFLRGRKRVEDSLILLFACMNLKKLAMWKQRNGLSGDLQKLLFIVFPFLKPQTLPQACFA
jgi:transposase/transcription elongation factor Elf1